MVGVRVGVMVVVVILRVVMVVVMVAVRVRAGFVLEDGRRSEFLTREAGEGDRRRRWRGRMPVAAHMSGPSTMLRMVPLSPVASDRGGTAPALSPSQSSTITNGLAWKEAHSSPA
jgi:hypothetical protein